MSVKISNLSDEFHFAIASVAVRSTQLDHHVERVIDLALRDQPRTAEFILKNLSGDRIVGVMQAILLDAFPDEPASISKLIALINNARSERNKAMHWLWGLSNEDGRTPLLRHRPYRTTELRIKTSEDIQKIADDLLLAGQALLRWQDTVAEQFPQASHNEP